MTPNVVCSPDHYWSTTGTTDQWTVVGELHTEKYFDQSYFGYGSAADSNIEVAVSNNGTNWSFGGTTNLSASTSGRQQLDEGTYNFANQLQAFMHYAKQVLMAPPCTLGNQQIIAQYWNGGSVQVGNFEGQFDNNPQSCCTNAIIPSSSYLRNASTAYTYGTAVSAFGVSLSASSGYSSYVEMYWHNPASGQKMYLVGNDAHISTAHLIYVSYWCPSYPGC